MKRYIIVIIWVLFTTWMVLSAQEKPNTNSIKFETVIRLKVDSVVTVQDSTVYWMTVNKSNSKQLMVITVHKIATPTNTLTRKHNEEIYIDIEY